MQILFRTLLIFTITISNMEAWAEEEVVETPKAVYYAIDEPFTINFLNQSQDRARYLQIKVSLMSHKQETINNASNNLPMLQDALRGLFSEQTFDDVNSTAARRQLQASALEVTNTILKEEIGSDPIDAIYFTSFVLQ